MLGPNRYARLARDKHYSFKLQIKLCDTIGTAFITLYFLCNLQMGPMGMKARPGTSLKLTGPIDKLSIKLCETAGTAFITLYFLCNLQMGPIGMKSLPGNKILACLIER